MQKYTTRSKDAKPGMVFNKLTLISLYSPPRPGVHPKWLCLCECGKETVVSYGNLKNAHTASCGCVLKGKIRTMNKTHGYCGSITYNSWQAMKRRCSENNPFNGYSPSKYLEKGIKFCERWDSFENFLEDMGERPGRGYSLDRIDNNKDYCLENCKWSTFKEQSRNKDDNVFLEFNGERKTIAEWAEILNIPPARISARIKKLGWSIEKTLTEPKQGSQKNK